MRSIANQEDQSLDVYSNGLAAIFLCELVPQQYAREIEWFLGRMQKRQKNHGGWGYETYQTGDTSQTQYGTLSYWEAHRNGFRLEPTSVENVADWLIRTQDPTGVWGYQGEVAPANGPLIAASGDELLDAGRGTGKCVCLRRSAEREAATDRSQAIRPRRRSEPGTGRPAARAAAGRIASQSGSAAIQQIRAQRTDMNKLLGAINRAHGWMEKNYTIDIGPKCYYYLYALERYKSFQESFEGNIGGRAQVVQRRLRVPGQRSAGERQLVRLLRPRVRHGVFHAVLAALHAKEHPRQARRRNPARRPRPATQPVSRKAAQRPGGRRPGAHQGRSSCSP